MSIPFPLHPLRVGLSHALLCSALLLSAPLAVQAQDADAREYHLAQGDLGQVLTRFASEAGVVLSFDPALTRGQSSAGLDGHYGVEEGLGLLLSGSGLQAVRTSDGRYQLIPAGDGSGALELGATSIVSNQLGTITEDSGSYTPGTIATATRLVLTPRETPQSISVVTRQHMDDFALNSIDQVMAHTPGISIVTFDSERNVYFARGFSIDNFQYDGVPMTRNSAYSAGNTLSDMAIYDRVEVLKGATGLLTGSGDPGATINLIRKKPTHDFQGHLSLGAGRWDTYRSELDVSGPLTETGNLRGRAVAAHQKKHSVQDNYSRESTIYYGILEADLGEDTLLTLGADYQDNLPQGSTWGGNPIFDANGNFNDRSRSFSNAAEWSTWEQYTRTLFATLEHHFANGWLGKLQLNHQINGYYATLGSAAAGNPDPATGTGASMWTGKYTGETVSDAVDAYLSGPFQAFGREHELVVGGSLARREWDGKGYWGYAYDGEVSDYYGWNGKVPEPEWGEPSGINDELIRERGAYLATRLNLADDLKAILGVRVSDYEGEDIRESGVPVPYAGLVYDLTDNLSAYASYTSIFKPQSIRDLDSRTLDPLEGDSYEAGFKAEFFDGRLNASLAYFEIKQDNYGEAVGTVPGTGEVAYQAVQGVRTKGYEAEISGRLAEGWNLQADFTHKIARLDSEKISTLEPENQFSVQTTYQLHGALSPVTLGGGARWQDRTWGSVWNAPLDRYQDFGQDDFWLLNVMARYQVSDNLSATLTVDNLLDEKYLTLMDFYSTYSWGEPRNVMLTTRYDF